MKIGETLKGLLKKDQADDDFQGSSTVELDEVNAALDRRLDAIDEAWDRRLEAAGVDPDRVPGLPGTGPPEQPGALPQVVPEGTFEKLNNLEE